MEEFSVETKSQPSPSECESGEGSDYRVVGTTISAIKPHIINLSKLDLESSHIKLLEKSDKFSPTPVYSDLLDLEINTKEFIRKVHLKAIFANSNIQPEKCLVQEKGSYIPPECKDPFLAVVLSQMKNVAETLETYHSEKVRDNLSSEERRALTDLMSKEDIIIKTADKGASWVIMDKDYYAQAMEKALSNPGVYKKIAQKL